MMGKPEDKQSLFRTFAVPTYIIPRVKHELDAEHRENLRRHITIVNHADFYRRKRQLGQRRSHANKKRAAQ